MTSVMILTPPESVTAVAAIAAPSLPECPREVVAGQGRDPAALCSFDGNLVRLLLLNEGFLPTEGREFGKNPVRWRERGWALVPQDGEKKEENRTRHKYYKPCWSIKVLRKLFYCLFYYLWGSPSCASAWIPWVCPQWGHPPCRTEPGGGDSPVWGDSPAWGAEPSHSCFR